MADAVGPLGQRRHEGEGPLAGIRILNVGTMLGLGHLTALLADFGAQVICVEHPTRGDPLRQLGPFKGELSLRWAVVGRGKRSITVDLHDADGQRIVRDLAAQSDVLVENFRPGTLARWGLSPESLMATFPSLIVLSLTGYGQTGPARDKPGFGRVIEAVSGVMNSTGDADGPPTQIGVPLVDYIAGTFGAMAIAMALFARSQDPDHRGQHIDLSLYESVIRLCESLIATYELSGTPPGRSGNRYRNIAPSDVYRTADGRYVFHSSATQSVYERLMQAIGRPELIADPRFATNAERVQRVDEINDIVQEWFGARPLKDAVRVLESFDVPVGPVKTIDEVVTDPQLLGRQSIIEVDVPGYGSLRQPGLVPKFSRTPGQVSHSGPALGQHTAEILTELLGYSADEIGRLGREGVI